MSIKKTISIAQKYLQTVKNVGIPVSKAYIFGSQINGKMHLGSDIDICVISPAFGKDRQKERVQLMNLRDETTVLVEPHPYSPSDFQNHLDPLSLEVKKTGILV